MIELLIALVIIGAVIYLIQLLPIDGMIKQVIVVIAVVAVVIYALRTLAPMAGLG